MQYIKFKPNAGGDANARKLPLHTNPHPPSLPLSLFPPPGNYLVGVQRRQLGGEGISGGGSLPLALPYLTLAPRQEFSGAGGDPVCVQGGKSGVWENFPIGTVFFNGRPGR